jgi:hypothetical protein
MLVLTNLFVSHKIGACGVMKAAGTRPDLLLACPTQLGLFCAFHLVVGDDVEIICAAYYCTTIVYILYCNNDRSKARRW